MKNRKNIAVCNGLTFTIQKKKMNPSKNMIVSKIAFRLYLKFKFVRLFLNKSATLIWSIVSKAGFANIKNIKILKNRIIKYS